MSSSSNVDASSAFFDAVKGRRSVYHISSDTTIPDSRVIEVCRDLLKSRSANLTRRHRLFKMPSNMHLPPLTHRTDAQLSCLENITRGSGILCWTSYPSAQAPPERKLLLPKCGHSRQGTAASFFLCAKIPYCVNGWTDRDL
jgi:hypothetical protein